MRTAEKTRLIVCMGAALLAGCVYHRRVPFSETECAHYRQDGTASVHGDVFLKTMAGDVKYGAGNAVYLYPATAYVQEWFQHDIILVEPVVPDPDPRLAGCRRETVADGQGRFRFERLPAGQYVVTCGIHWLMSNGRTTGGIAYTTVRV